MATETGALSASALADLAGVTEAEVDRLVGLGVLAARDGADPFLAADVQKVRLATACEQAGLPMEGIASAIRAGRLSFAFLEASPFRRWAVRSARTYRQVSEETGAPLELLRTALASMGFASVAPEDRIREDELEIVPLLQLGHTTGVLDQAWMSRVGRTFHFWDPAGAALAALGMAEELPLADLPPAHVGVAAGPVVAQGGDYFGRTVNLAARIAARASAGQVLVTQSVVETASPQGVTFVELEEVRLEGISRPVRVFEARRA